MKKQLILTFLFGALTASAAAADETGLAGIHDWKKEKQRRICMSSHFHDGSGTGKTREAAEKAALRSWADFTVFEYGTSWGSYKRAASKAMDCSQIGASWSCFTSARPCKRHIVRKPGLRRSASR